MPDASSANEGVYQVVLNNPAGKMVSKEVKLTVVQPVEILAEPEGATKLLGSVYTLGVVASGSEPLDYQWYKGGQKLENANGKILSLHQLKSPMPGHIVSQSVMRREL